MYRNFSINEKEKRQILEMHVSKGYKRSLNENELWDKDFAHRDSTDPLDYDDPRDDPEWGEEEHDDFIGAELVQDNDGYLELYIDGEKDGRNWGFYKEGDEYDYDGNKRQGTYITTVTNPKTGEDVKIIIFPYEKPKPEFGGGKSGYDM